MNRIEIKHRISRDIFILFCALNAMGYDDENNEKGMFPVRKNIRKYLLKHNWGKKYPQLKKIIKRHHPSNLLIELLSKPLVSRKKKIIKNLSVSDIFILNLKNFSNEPLIKKLWKKFKNFQTKENKKIFSLFKRETIGLLKFIGKLSLDIKKIIFVVNPLDVYWRGYGFKINKIGYVIVGPGADKNRGELLRHEFLHILAPNFRIPSKIIAGQKTKTLIDMGYTNKKIINREYVVRGLNLLYKEKVLKKDMSRLIKKEKKDFPRIEDAIKFLKKKLKRGRW